MVVERPIHKGCVVSDEIERSLRSFHLRGFAPESGPMKTTKSSPPTAPETGEQATTQSKPDLLSPHDAAALIGVHPVTLRRYRKDGKLAARRLPGGGVRYARSDIFGLLETVQG